MWVNINDSMFDGYQMGIVLCGIMIDGLSYALKQPAFIFSSPTVASAY